ncbi:MAG TPA: hypothetical protein VM240_01285 [Verrucomicrobiae bacterium]|nr:hypothetical protein [Verrucomicrobiae bacterium]
MLVFERSTRTHVALVLGLVGFVSLLWLGHHMASQVAIEGALAPLHELARERILARSEKGAFVVLVMFWSLAYRFFRRDWTRILGE